MDRYTALHLYHDTDGLLVAEPVDERPVLRMDRALICAAVALLIVVPIVLGVLAVLP